MGDWLPAFGTGFLLAGLFLGFCSWLYQERRRRIVDPNDLDRDLDGMSRKDLVSEAKKLRTGIREHRDATDHDLCWYQPGLWSLLPEKVEPKPEVPPKDEFLRCCALYRDSLEPK
jgi:hypothetical protein